MKTNYPGHNERYLQRRREGGEGWAPPEVVRENLEMYSQVLQSPWVPKGGNLLELGCGAGNITLWLAEKGYHAWGIDIAPAAVKWAMEKSAKTGISAAFLKGNVLDLPFEKEYFDFVLDGHCFHCIIGQDRKRFLKEAKKVLKPGGFFHINTMCGEVGEKLQKEHGWDPETRCMMAGEIATRYIGSVEDIVEEVKEADFEILQQKVLPKTREDDLPLLLLDLRKPG